MKQGLKVATKKAETALKKQLNRKFSNVDTENIVNQNVWCEVDDEDVLYELGVIKNCEGEVYEVEINNKTKQVNKNQLCNVNININSAKIEDMARLTHINDAAILDFLRKRYLDDEIYTYAGRLLVVLNPFKLIPHLYEPSTIFKYQSADTSRGFPSDLPPHTFAVAQCALNNLKIKKENQSCIVSGESGAGKTETARQLMNFFATNKTVFKDNKVQDIILGANPLLEALGNAKTERNNNSSRFGRFIKMWIGENEGICGGFISFYMLELSRIEHQGNNERNYHIFYQIIKALPDQLKNEYKLLNMESYTFLNRSGCYDVDTVDDCKEFVAIQKQLNILFSAEEIAFFYKALSGVLLAGNIKFKELEKDNVCAPENQTDFSILCSLLGVAEEEFQKAITFNRVVIQNNAIFSPNSVNQCSIVCKAMSKDLYSMMFSFVIDKINLLIKFEDKGNPWIGILDIYGFEFFENNSYEQFLINFANEKLQQFFVQSVFEAEKVEYEAEGLDHSMIDYVDNVDIIALFEKPKESIFSYLEEQCLFQTGNSEAFTVLCNNNLKSPHYEQIKGREREAFKIIHTAAPVVYNTKEFVPKNKHKLPNEIIELWKKSTNSVVKQSFETVELLDSKSIKGKFMGSKFQKSMVELLKVLRCSQSHFIRCIKPNQLKKPHVFHALNTLNQLLSLSVLESIMIIHKGFAYRDLFTDFLKNNYILMGILDINTEEADPKTLIQKTLASLNIPISHYQLGSTKIFLKKDAWLMIDKFFRKSINKIYPLILTLQSIYRAYKNRLFYNNFTLNVVRIQSCFRRYNKIKNKHKNENLKRIFIGFVLFLKFLNMKMKEESSCLIIQKYYRGHRERKKFKAELKKRKVQKNIQAIFVIIRVHKFLRYLYEKIIKYRRIRAAIKIQSYFRGYLSRKMFKKLKLIILQNNAAISIQKYWRCYACRMKYLIMKLQIPFAIKIQAAWRGYKFRKSSQYKEFKILFDKSIDRIKKECAIIRIQGFLRKFFVQGRIKNLTQAALTLQKFAWSRLLFTNLTRMKLAAIKIQAAWRGNRVRKIIKEEKLKLLIFSEVVKAQNETKHHREIASSIFKEKKLNQVLLSGYQIIHINVWVEHQEVYPFGWIRGIEQINSFNPKANIKRISCGAFHTVVLSNTGYLYTFGLNDKCQLGTGNNVSLPLPAYPLISLDISKKIKEIACGVDHTIVLFQDGYVFAWGSNSRGQCGCKIRHVVVKRPSRVYFPEGIMIVQISAGAFHNGCLDVEGNLFMWGRRDYISLEGILNDLRFPMLLDNADFKAIGKIKLVRCGVAITYLLNEEGSVYVFGSTNNGQLGLGKRIKKIKKPTLVDELSDITDIQCGCNSTLCLSDAFSKLYMFGTFLLWNDKENVCVKAQSFTPFLVDFSFNDIKLKPIKCASAWWESIIVTSNGQTWAWNFFKRGLSGELIPQLHEYSLAKGLYTSSIHVVWCPSFTAVFAAFSEEEADIFAYRR